MAIRAAVYCRISDDRSGEAAGVERQEKDCRELCERRGWDVHQVFVDNSKSAWKRERRRPGWDALLEGLRHKEYDAVVVYHGDRLMRQPRDLEDLLDIADQGVQLASPTGQRDLSNPDDRFILRIEVAHACRSSDDTSRRTKRKHLALAEAGAAVGGGRPFGYEQDRLTIRPEEAELVREAAGRVLAGESLRAVCMDWTTRGLVTTQGKPWNQTTLRRLLRSARIAGMRSYGKDGPIVAIGAWPAIVDADTSTRLRALLYDETRRVNAAHVGPRRYLLTGLAYCGRCQVRLIARVGNGRRRTYICAAGPPTHGCGGIRVVAEPSEQWVSDLVFARLDSAEYAEAMGKTTPDDDLVLAEIVAAEAKLVDLAGAWASDGLSRAEWLAARKAVESRLQAAQQRLMRQTRDSAAVALVGRGAALREGWEGTAFLSRRAVLESVIARITVSRAAVPRGRFDPARISVEWRY